MPSDVPMIDLLSFFGHGVVVAIDSDGGYYYHHHVVVLLLLLRRRHRVHGIVVTAMALVVPVPDSRNEN